MLTVVTFKWQAPARRGRPTYTAEHVNVLRSMVKQHYRKPHRFICITDDPAGVECETFPLWPDCNGLRNASGDHLPSCYRRLKLFSEEVGKALKAERIVSIDLDTVILRDLSPVWDRTEDFVGWRVRGLLRDRDVYNGSMVLFTAGLFSWLWEEFDPMRSPGEANRAGYFGSDQAWMSYKLGIGAGWTHEDGLYSYPYDLASGRRNCADCRIAFFNGKLKPWDIQAQRQSPWIRAHWRMQELEEA